MEALTVYCPKCGRKVAKYDGRSTIDIVVNCRKCSKQIVYRVATKKIEIADIPMRKTSSGITFR
jgi:DNA-directed RNA polymerase subunit RPC12/RpoP